MKKLIFASLISTSALFYSYYYCYNKINNIDEIIDLNNPVVDLVIDSKENTKLDKDKDKDNKRSDKIIIYKKPVPIYKLYQKQEWEII
tara:strand:- start:214 stop:477 length:264 start_codon:yes stop_codon:yes gene_type:complete